VSRTKVEL